MKVQLFKNWLDRPTTTLTESIWNKPVEAEVIKSTATGKHNVIQVKSSGKVYKYAIVGVTLSGSKYDINFGKLEKTSTGGLMLHRTVEGGYDPYEVKYSQISTTLPKLAAGKGDVIKGWLGDIYFNKIA